MDKSRTNIINRRGKNEISDNLVHQENKEKKILKKGVLTLFKPRKTKQTLTPL